MKFFSARADVKFPLLLIGLSVGFLSCSLAEDSLLSQEEANARIAAAYLLKDMQCQANHALTIPIFTKAKKKDIETCALEILATDCNLWSGPNNLPFSCLAISISL